MTNLNSPGLGFDPNHGRRVLGRFSQEATARAKAIAASRPFVAFVVVAAVLVGFYYFVIATPIYVSEASFSVRGRESSPIAGGLLSAIGGNGSPTQAETSEINRYVQSYEMLDKLDKRFNLRARYSQPRVDLFRHMSANAKREDFLAFYRKMVAIHIEHETNIITLEAKAFDAKSSQELADAILDITGDYIDGLSGQVRRETLKSSEVELQKAETAVRESRLAMTQYRTASGMLDPMSSAAAASGSVESMRAAVIQSQAEMAGLMTYNQPSAPAVVQLRARIQALQSQITQSQNRMTNPTAPTSLAQQLYQYEGLMVANEYAEKQLVGAMTAYDTARAIADQRERFLVRIINPHLPDKATEPNRMLSFIETMVVLIAGYGIIALAVAGIRDHQGI